MSFQSRMHVYYLWIYKNPTSNIALLKNATWTLSNLCRGKNPPLKVEYVSKPSLSHMNIHLQIV